MEDITGNTPAEKWENLKNYLLEQMGKIDKETPWQETEPQWWVEMASAERYIRAKRMD